MAKKKQSSHQKRQPSREERRLSVVMFTDMVGYSALTQSNESLALRLLEEHRQMLRPLFVNHGGKEIKTIGDAFLIEFASALAAAQCAIEIQKTLFDRNQKNVKSPPILIRIGLHIGDVVFKERDVYGDGVNIASRIEPLAEPGGICISEDVSRQIHNKLGYPLIRLGKGELKNIQLPVNLYRIVLPWKKNSFGFLEQLTFLLSKKRVQKSVFTVGLAVLFLAAYSWWSWQRPAGPLPKKNVAVLPLLNISSSPHEEYFADGMTEEIISHLAMIRDLSVIARTSVSKYNAGSMDVAQIGRELNVGTILEGSVQTSGNRARIIVNLIDVNSQQHLWTQEYNREIKDLFAVQTDIAMNVTGALKAELLTNEMTMLTKKGTENNAAHDLYLQGLSHLNLRTGDEIVKAIDFFTEAITQDSNFAPAYAGLAECYTLAGNAGYSSLPREQAIVNARRYAAAAIALDPTDAEAHNSLAYVKFRIDWDWTSAEREFTQALRLKPSYAKAHEWYGLYLSIMGRFDEALAEMKRAQELDPLSPSVATGIGRILHFSERYQEAIEQFQKTIATHADYAEAHFGLGMTLTTIKRFEDAEKELSIARKLSGDRSVVVAMTGVNFGMWGRKREALRILHQFDTPSRTGDFAPYFRGLIYASIGDLDHAVADLERSYRAKEGLLIYGSVEPIFANLRVDPRFRALMKRMGLQH